MHLPHFLTKKAVYEIMPKVRHNAHTYVNNVTSLIKLSLLLESLQEGGLGREDIIPFEHFVTTWNIEMKHITIPKVYTSHQQVLLIILT